MVNVQGRSVRNRSGFAGWLIVAAASAALLVGWLVTRSKADKATTTLRESTALPGDGERSNSNPHMARIESALGELDRRSVALEHAVQVATNAAASAGAARPEPAAPLEDKRSELEIQRDTLRDLDVVLATTKTNGTEERRAADTLRGELALAGAGHGRVSEVECATAFCKATFEEDIRSQPELDTNALIEKSSFLKREAMFDYVREGGIKRTIVYTAREGQMLPLPRDNNGAPALAGGVTAPPAER